MLDEPDPRGPRTTQMEGNEVTVASEVVRVNHRQNCLLCHAPIERNRVPEGTLVAEVPVPSESGPTPGEGYGSNPENNILVRIDVTYLRQDFSMKLAVADADPWPEMQRYDFLVRTRAVTDLEADKYRELLQPSPEAVSPYRRAALSALRELTGLDAEPTATAWRKLTRH